MPSVITGSQVSANTGLITALSTGAAGTPGTVTGRWTLTTGSTWEATFADLAEYYQADEEYEPGTVLIFGGEKEVTLSTQAHDTRVAGVVSTNPAYTMNKGIEGTVACVALQGKVPVRVVGIVRKGDLLVTSNEAGCAQVSSTPGVGTLIGKSLEDKFDQEVSVINAAIGRF
jgi:hypothetical protein